MPNVQPINNLDITNRAKDELAKLDKISQKSLPYDIETTVSKTKFSMVDAMSKISAFFQSMKNIVLRKENIGMNEIANRNAYNKKLEIYNGIKLRSHEKAYLKLIGRNLSSLEDLLDLQNLKEIDSKVFNFFKAIESKKDVSRIKSRLKEIKENSPKNNYYLVLVHANKLATSQEASSEVRDFLKSKLEKIAVEKINEKFKKSENIIMIPRPKEGLTNVQKLAIGAGFTALGLGSVAGYYYLTPAAAPALGILETIHKLGNEANGIGKITEEATKQIPAKVVSDQPQTLLGAFDWVREMGNKANGIG